MNAVATLPAVPRGEHVAMLLRLSPHLAARIKELARLDYRSYQGQVTMMLEQWLAEHAPDEALAGPTIPRRRPRT